MHLRQVAGELKARGVRVIITATRTAGVERVFGPYFQVVRVQTTRRNAWSREMENVTRLIIT